MLGYHSGSNTDCLQAFGQVIHHSQASAFCFSNSILDVSPAIPRVLCGEMGCCTQKNLVYSTRLDEAKNERVRITSEFNI